MTNINCSSNCIYQKDGKCTLDNVTNVSVTSIESCAYFVDKHKKDNSGMVKTIAYE